MYDPNTEESLTFNIESYALRKALGKKITEIYMSSGVFTDYSR